MGERRAVTNQLATKYRQASRAGKSEILDDLVELTGWHMTTPAPRSPGRDGLGGCSSGGADAALFACGGLGAGGEVALLVAMSPATIDRRLQEAKVLARFTARSHT